MSVSIVAESSALSTDEANRKLELERVIESGLQTFHDVGNALLEIRESRLYRDSHGTFEDYCKERWGFVASRARQLIGAAEVINNLQSVTNVTPANEGQARALAKFDPDLQPAVMKVADAFSKATGKPVTAGMLERTGEVLTEAATTGHVDTGSGESTAFWAAVVAQEYEASQRQEQHVRDNSKEARERRRAERKAEYEKLIRETPLPVSTYRVIYADPPWSYNNSGVINEADAYGRAERHYNTMPLSELLELPVDRLAYKDAVLFLWATSPLLPDALKVIEAWGFTYKTSFVWDKVGHNFGHYNSVRHELLLVATKGSCTPDTDELFDSVVTIEKSRVHSEKPEYFRELIDRLYTYGERIELFARKAAGSPNGLEWEAWGNEV